MEEPHPPGLHLATHVDPSKVNDEIPSEAEVEAAVCHLHLHRAGRHTHLHAEHFKNWCKEAYPGEQSNTPPRMEHWQFLVDILKNMWRMGEIPQYLGWTVLFLIHKGITYTWGIVLMETLWKVVEALIDTRLRASLQFHDILHGFWARRGTGTAIMELKIPQELASLDREPLFLVSLDIRKAYYTVDRESLVQTLEKYGAGTCVCQLLETFWAYQKAVPRHNGYHGPAFPATRGMMQGSLLSTTLFNAVVGNFIRTWLVMTVEDKRVDHNRM